MSGLSMVASRYAGALLDLANEQKIADKVHSDLLGFHQVWVAEAEVRAFLNNPVLAPGKKLPFFSAAFSKAFQPLTFQFFEKLLKGRRTNILGEVAMAYDELYRDQMGVVRVLVKSSAPLTDASRNRIKEMVQASSLFKGRHQIQLNESVDATLIGGVVVRVEDQQWDASIKTKLDSFKREFEDNPYVAEY
jgi:F-type H+-transporting ATPase subunit delta